MTNPTPHYLKHTPADDPCFAFLENPSYHLSPEVDTTNFDKANDLLRDLVEFDDKLTTLHHLVAIPRTPNSWQSVTDKPCWPPQLPRGLVYAFEELVSYLLVTMDSMSVYNRAIYQCGSNLPSDAEEHLARIDELRSHVRSCVYALWSKPRMTSAQYRSFSLQEMIPPQLWVLGNFTPTRSGGLF